MSANPAPRAPRRPVPKPAPPPRPLPQVHAVVYSLVHGALVRVVAVEGDRLRVACPATGSRLPGWVPIDLCG